MRFIYGLDYGQLYEFFPVNGQMGMDWGRRESVMVVPGLDSVLDGNGRKPGPEARRDFAYTFRLHVADGDLDAAYDRLAAVVAPGYPVLLVYTTDANIKAGGTDYWYTVAYNAAIRHTRTAANRYGSRGEVDFSVTWRIRPDWRPRYSEASDIWGVNDGVWGTGDGTWGAGFVIPLAAALVAFNVDATGTAGLNLPTLPDTGPVVTVTGPYGGDAGIEILNFAASTTDDQGNPAFDYFVIPQVPAGVSCLCDCSRQRFLMGGVPFRPSRPLWQTEYLRIVPGVVNGCQILCLGQNPTVGGSLVLDWWRKRV